ncbi:hypothetical protein EV193_101973 [Herbihabitans rhizosphaerae]|uniref:Uncharacterized protein n=1 Tax=Herbihabitans rhizosphaerae TaxID=1872711 RepID=A0A4Q7L6V1_9PSEU|nr:DUF5825 family protein [Herbihabitans rhizosphaerae]RZS45087.1 hypothetical protein EV193_101973 [Herbihabitans rhizosphaerae]
MWAVAEQPAWPASVTVALDDPGPHGRVAAAAVERAAAAGQRITFDRTVHFGQSAVRDALVLTVLREAMSNLVPVDWSARGDLPWPSRLVVHLPPPSVVDSESGGAWRAEHRFGQCWYRVGPSFLVIKDVRPGRPKARTLVPGEWTEAFLALASGDGVPRDEWQRVMLDRLVRARLAIMLDERGVVLPYRMCRWPIAAT